MAAEVKLSDRLMAVASLIPPGSTLVDVGTDHGYLPIYAVLQGICPSAVAADVNAGPLERAAGHVEEAGLSDRIRLIRSDGLAEMGGLEGLDGPLSLSITGMGGPLITRIITEFPEVTARFSRVIASPQSGVREFRLSLEDAGFPIEDEVMVEDDGKFYTIIRFIPVPAGTAESPFPRELTLRFGRALLEKRDPVLKAALERELARSEGIAKSLRAASATAEISDRLAEVEEDIDLCTKALEAINAE
ncbi:MAG: class I SAM-dependent methyltransferase [Eubacterium sp.]|nr:class I SAM-dependent methyltransferase [Eubacterium sp.]